MRKPGRPPIADRRQVRTEHVTIKLSARELAQIRELAELERAERAKRGQGSNFSVGRYLRELIAAEARRRGVRS